MRVALLEDDHDQAELVKTWLTAEGHHCHLFENARAFMIGASRESYDIFIIDWMLPDISGVDVLDWVRRDKGWDIPVLFRTVKDKEEDIVVALDRGADDYVVKDDKPRELIARANALVRRASSAVGQQEDLDCPPYHLDLNTRELTHNDEPVSLTQKEFELALFLFRNVGRLLSRGYILESVWGRRADINTRTVDTHVSRVRTKLGIQPEDGWRLSAVYQHGYRLERLAAD